MIVDRLLPFSQSLPARSWPRSLAKTLTWRLFATADTFIISALVTRNLKLSGSIVAIEILTKMVWYLLHERAWARLSFGTSVQAAQAIAVPVRSSSRSTERLHH